jgi:hypothetical protein
VCAPQGAITHAEYSQIIRARVAAHRARNDAAALASGANPRVSVGPVASTAAPIHPRARRPLAEGPNEGQGPPKGVRPARDSPLRIVDAPIAKVFDTVEWKPLPGEEGAPPPPGDARSDVLRTSSVRVVRRYGVWYGINNVFTDDRVVAGVKRKSGRWLTLAKRDAAAVVARIELCGHRRLKKLEMTVDRRGIPGGNRVVRAEALCAYESNGQRRLAKAAHCVSLLDARGNTCAGLIYLPIDDE